MWTSHGTLRHCRLRESGDKGKETLSTSTSLMETVVRFFILEEDQYTEPQHPNIFRLNKPSDQLQLKDMKDRLSDWKGGFQFFFKTHLEGDPEDQFVWELVRDDNQHVPTFHGQVTFKAVRTGFKQFFEIRSRDKEYQVNQLIQKKRPITGAPLSSPRNNPQPSPRTTSYSPEEEKMLAELEQQTHCKLASEHTQDAVSVAELRAMYLKFKKETPSLEIDKAGFVKVTKGMGINDEFLQDLIFNKFDTDKSGSVDFREFMQGLSIITRGTPEEKLKCKVLFIL